MFVNLTAEQYRSFYRHGFTLNRDMDITQMEHSEFLVLQNKVQCFAG